MNSYIIPVKTKKVIKLVLLKKNLLKYFMFEHFILEIVKFNRIKFCLNMTSVQQQHVNKIEQDKIFLNMISIHLHRHVCKIQRDKYFYKEFC